MDQQADDVVEDLSISIELSVPVSQMWTGSHSHGQQHEVQS